MLLVVALLAAVWLVARSVDRGTDPGVRSPGRSATATSGADPARRHTDDVSGLPWVAESALPREARRTLELIAAGGPFPFPRNDNQTFSNREGLLPKEARGYYREFTVVTPGSDDRGARRIVTGREGEKYWTDDHYASFSRIREGT